jgi:hypothetical protein
VIQGLDGMVALMVGNALIAVSYIFLGPIPGLEIISGWANLLSTTDLSIPVLLSQ